MSKRRDPKPIFIDTHEIECLLKEIREVWKGRDGVAENNWLFNVWLIQTQIDEINEGKYTGQSLLNELADILIITFRWLDSLGIDVSKLILHRLNTRHKGKIKEIAEKYEKKWSDYIERH